MRAIDSGTVGRGSLASGRSVACRQCRQRGCVSDASVVASSRFAGSSPAGSGEPAATPATPSTLGSGPTPALRRPLASRPSRAAARSRVLASLLDRVGGHPPIGPLARKDPPRVAMRQPAEAAVPRAAWGRAGPDVACSPCRAPPRSSVRGCRCPRRSRPLSSAVAPSASTTPRLASLLLKCADCPGRRAPRRYVGRPIGGHAGVPRRQSRPECQRRRRS